MFWIGLLIGGALGVMVLAVFIGAKETERPRLIVSGSIWLKKGEDLIEFTDECLLAVVEHRKAKGQDYVIKGVRISEESE